MNVKRESVYVIVNRNGNVRGVGIDSVEAWNSAYTTTKKSEDSLRNEGHELKSAQVIDTFLFNELFMS